MTTVVYRNNEMAGDTLLGNSGSILGYSSKIFKNKKGWLLGISGSAEYSQIVKDWFMRMNKISDIVQPWEVSLPELVNAIIVASPSQIYRFEGKQAMKMLLPRRSPFIVVGSGTDVAYGALAMGATAKQAVEIAIKWSPGTGGKVEVLKLGE